MKQIYETPWLLWIEFTNDVVTASFEGDDNVGDMPESGWVPGA